MHATRHTKHMNMMNYSIIIPHKNTPVLLNRMLNSIPLRHDCEIIIIDDNSSEKIVDFNNFPGISRPDTTIILSKEGRGAGYCRNEGLKYAKGEWVFFADADDIFTDSITYLFDKYANVSSIDMVFINAKAFNEKGETYDLALNKYISNYLKGKKDALQILRFQYWTPWSRLIKRKVLVDNSVKFEEVKVGNDTMGILYASKYAERFSVEKEVLYLYYRPITRSQTSRAYKETYFSRMDLRFRINEFYIQNNYPYLWPITRDFTNKKMNSSDEAKEIRSKYNYRKANEVIIFIKYIYYKVIGRI